MEFSRYKYVYALCTSKTNHSLLRESNKGQVVVAG